MSTTALIRYSGRQTALYPAVLIARLARVPLSFVYACEAEGLIQGYELPHGGYGYLSQDVTTLARIYRLYTHLELDLHAIAVVLHLREQIEQLQRELYTLRQQLIHYQTSP
ncbi:MAG: hypothetical protein D6711_00355 [Chloroflexi bacterium]|nr:MAG: hypothetical protein D6711_00355 [Chloroflexota bacterium]